MSGLAASDLAGSVLAGRSASQLLPAGSFRQVAGTRSASEGATITMRAAGAPARISASARPYCSS